MVQPDSGGQPILSEFANEPDMAELVNSFVSELPEKVQAVRAAYESRDLATLAMLAHRLKGAAGGYGFPMVTDAAAALESSVKAGPDPAALREQVEALIDLCARARACPVDGDA